MSNKIKKQKLSIPPMGSISNFGFNKLTKTKGFTLIELVVVMSLIIMLMLTATSLFFITLVSNSKSNVIQTVKEEGEFAMSQIEFLLRNSIQLLPNGSGQTCATNMDEIVFRSLDNGTTSIFAEEDSSDPNNALKIASNSGVYLTSSAVDLNSGPIFSCTQNVDKTSTFIDISFTLRKGLPGVDKPEEIVEQTFTSSVNLRNY